MPRLSCIQLTLSMVSLTQCLAWVPNLHFSKGLSLSSQQRRPPTQMRMASIVSDGYLQQEQLDILDQQNYLIVENFLPESLQTALRRDIDNLRSKNCFKIARIGQDQTNTLNTDIRVAETCFIGPSKLSEVPLPARDQLYHRLDQVRETLQKGNPGITLDPNLTELLYAYYPKGGFYRRHRDAIPGSASTLRKYSLLLYLNDPSWDCTTDGGALRLHLDSGGDELPTGESPNFIDVTPAGGTLVLFPSDRMPHEVLDTTKERMAVVGWYNRPVQASDALELASSNNMLMDSIRPFLLVLAAGLIAYGVMDLLS